MAGLHSFIRFGMVGVFNTGVDLGVFWLLLNVAGVPLFAANGISFLAAVSVSYLLNRSWTFGLSAVPFGSLRSWLLFCLVSLGGLVISTAILFATRGTLDPMLAKVAAVFGTLLWNYFGARRIAFAKELRND